MGTAPLKRAKTYQDVYRIACEAIMRCDVPERCALAGAGFDGKGGSGRASLGFFDDTIFVAFPGLQFRSEGGANITLVTRIILLHYLLRASGRPLGGEPVAYGDIPELRHYLPVFEKRVERPLARAFGTDPHAFLDAGLAMGGTSERYGDAAFTLYGLPRVPLTFILWGADAEFPPSARVLFDPSVTSYLPLEDIGVIAKLGASRVLRAARRLYGDGDEEFL